MIFVTLGSQKFQFNRLLISIDQLIQSGLISDKVFAQIGYSDYVPHSFKYTNFLDREKFTKYIDQSNVVITHGGTGAIIGAVKKGKKVIAVPRLSKYGEHVDDHQKQIIKQFAEMKFIVACYDVINLQESLSVVQNLIVPKYHSNTDVILESIDDFLESI